MKRELLFRGKRKDNEEWIEGAFCQYDCPNPFGAAVEMPSIIKYGEPNSLFWFEVLPESVSQYTGLTDKNGAKIFEGDILKTTSGHGFVNYNGGCFCVQDFNTKNNPAIDIVMLGNKVEVIGNIHDGADMRKAGE